VIRLSSSGDSEVKRGARKRQISIVPFETYDLSEFKDSLEAAALLYGLEPNFSTESFITSDLSNTETQRKQRDAVRLAKAARIILKATEENPKYALIVTKQDIFASRFNFVFGHANRELGVGVISTARLKEWYDGISPSIMKERVLKEAAHEIGHLGGLAHCENGKCLMAFSETLEMVDLKLPVLCSECKRKLRTEGK
jgi:predicted Zn-dependent protease